MPQTLTADQFKGQYGAQLVEQGRTLLGEPAQTLSKEQFEVQYPSLVKQPIPAPAKQPLTFSKEEFEARYGPAPVAIPEFQPTRGLFGEFISGIPVGIARSIEMYGRVGDLLNLPGAERLIKFGVQISPDPTGEGYIREALRGGMASTIQSIAAGIPGAVAGLAVGGPVGGFVGFALGGGTLFGLAEYHQFLDELEGAARESGATDEEVALIRSEMRDKALISGVAEAGFEAASTLIQMRIFGLLGGKALTEPAKMGLRAGLGRFFARTGRALPVELATELATTAVQIKTRQDAGIKTPSMEQALLHTIGPVIVQTLMVGAVATPLGTRMRREKPTTYEFVGVQEFPGKEPIPMYDVTTPEHPQYQSTLMLLPEDIAEGDIVIGGPLATKKPSPVVEPSPTEEGKTIIETMAGQKLRDEVEIKDIMPVVNQLMLTPEYGLRDFPEAQEMSINITRGDLQARREGSQDIAIFDKIKYPLNRAQQRMVIDAIKVLDKGKQYPIRKLRKKNPEVLKTARAVRKWFNEIREDIKDYKRVMYALALPDNVMAAFRDTIGGMNLVEAGKKHNVEKDELTDLVEEFREIDNWGLEDYITKMERGSYKFIDENGAIRLVGVTRKHAIRKAVDFLERHPEVKKLTLSTEPNIEKSYTAALTRKQYWTMRRLIESALKEMSDEINEEAIKRGIHKVVTIKPAGKFAGAMVKRRNILEGEVNIFDILPAYSHSIRKKTNLDPIIYNIRSRIESQPPNVRKLLGEQIDVAKGKYWLGDQVLDSMLKQFGAKPFAYTRGVAQTRRAITHMKLGYRPVAAFVNLAGGQGHVYVKVGSTYIRKGWAFMRTPEGKKFIKEEEVNLGMDFVTAELGGRHIRKSWYNPLTLFQMPEFYNRTTSLTSSYLYAKEKLTHEDGTRFTEAESREFARRSVHLQEFIYNTVSLPQILRPPTGKLVGQFKSYLVQEIQFIAQLKGVEWARYLGMMMAMAGPRGLLYMIKTLPFIGVFWGWDRMEEWLNRNVPRAARGLPGFAGFDITAPATFQLPNRPEDWSGPFLSDLIRLYKEVMKPFLEGEGYGTEDAIDWTISLFPAAYYWQQLVSVAFSDDGWVRDRQGRKKYQIDGWWQKLILATAAPPIEKSKIDVALRVLSTEERRRKRMVSKVVNRYLRYMLAGKEIPERVQDDIYRYGVTKQAFKEEMLRRELPPDILRLLKTPLISRERAMEALGIGE